MSKVRVFLAINLPVKMIEEIRKLQSRLRTVAGDAGVEVSWVPPPNMHVTMKFMGNIDEENCASIREKLRPELERRPAISVKVEEAGAFPDRQTPRVIWVGVHSEGDELEQLAGLIDTTLAGLGFPESEHSFHPHLTLGRVKGGAVDLLEECGDVSFGECSIHEVVLYKSTLQRRGAEYTPLARFPLVG